MGFTAVGGSLNSLFKLVAITKPGGAVPLNWELLFAGWGALIYSMSCLLISSLSDRIGRLPCIALASLGLAGANAMMGWQLLGDHQLWHFFLFWFIANVSFALFFTSVEGLLAEYQDHSIPLERRLGAYCVAWCLGDAIAALSTGTLKQNFGSELVYQLLALLCFASLLTTAFDWFKHGYRKLGDIDVGVADIRPQAPFHAVLARTGLFFTSMAYTSLVAIFPRFGRDFHHLNEATIGSLAGIIFWVSLGSFSLFPLWRQWHYKPFLQVLLQTPMILGLLIGILAPARAVLLLVFTFFLFGMGYSLSYFFSIYYSLLVPHNHARSGGRHEAFLGMGNLFGPFVSAGLIQAVRKTSLLTPERIGVVALAVALSAVLFSLALQLFLIYKYQHSRIQK